MRWKGNRSGRIDLKVRGLSRAGLVLASKPIDLGIAAVVEGNNAAMRAVAVSNGAVIGRAQARFAPMGGGPLLAELMNAPLFAQLRYVGPADTLWRLSGTETLDLSGPIAVGADIGGRLADPAIRGSLRTQSARLESPVTGMVIDQVQSQARFSGPQLIFTQISGKTAGGGTVTGSGSATFSGGRTGAQPVVPGQPGAAAQPRRYRRAGHGAAADPLGRAGRNDLGRSQAQQGPLPARPGERRGRRAATPGPRPRSRSRGHHPRPQDLHPWKLALKVAGGDLQVIGLGINSRWTTDLNVGGFADAPRFTGRADLIRGDYDFAGRNFKLDRGVIRFLGESPPNPLLDIQASAQVQGLDASVRVRGTGLKPEITFASTPQLPQDELLSRILFGTSITNLSAPEALQLASAVAALQSGSGSLDPINALRKAVGLDRLRIVPADVATGQKTAVAAGKYITRKMFVEVVTDGQGYSATRVEYQISRWLSLLSTISTVGRSGASVRISKDY